MRAYHGLDHVGEVLDAIDVLADHADDPDAVRLAGWFHDAVHEPARHDNEDASAAFAEAVLGQLGLGPRAGPLIEEVKRLVRLTAGHQADPDDRNGQVMIDADLAVLGSPSDRYFTYAADIRLEWAHIPADEYRVGRRWVLAAFLDREHIYNTELMQELREQRARANMAAEIEQLVEME